MSRILRRPMFRGGRVSSYGTGIASGLADGGRVNYAGGGQIGGGIIYGEPMADGRYGFKLPRFGPEITTGTELLNRNKVLNTVAPIGKVLPDDEDEGELTNAEILANQKAFEDKMSVNTWDEYISYDVKNRISGETTTHKRKNPDYDPPHRFVDAPTEGPGSGKITGKRKVYLTDEEMETVTTGEDNPFGYKDSDVIEDISTVKTVVNGNETEEPEINAREAVEANKKLFGELLGLDKARGQDIGDMLIGASAKLLKPGATVRSGLGEFMEAEAVRPSRRQKLQDTASGLAIQDYIAGKRSKEQIEALKGKIDYEYDKKFEMSMPQKDDTLQMAKTKLLALKQDPNSSKGIKHLIGIQDPANAENVFAAKKGLKMKDITNKKSKALKNLHVGYNILIDADTNTKKIIKYDGSGTFGGVTIVTLTELWTQA